MSTHIAMPLAALILAATLAAPRRRRPRRRRRATRSQKLSGDWKGGGTVTPADGKPKKVRCKVTYTVAGSRLSQHLRCAGIDYRINATTKLTDKGGKISGSWNESIYDANGRLTGGRRRTTSFMRGSAATSFSSRMSIKTSDAGHSTNIVELHANAGAYRLVASLSFHR